jgi:SRSO17 transposase
LVSHRIKKAKIIKNIRGIKGNSITVVIDETGDRKKGKRTDYVARQYLGSIGKIDSGIVSVNAYGIYQNITSPLIFKVFKPQVKLKEGDRYQTKIELASEIIKELIDFGFQIDLVLADSLYGESSSFIRTVDKYNLPWIVAIRSNHGVWMPAEQTV